VIASVDTYLRFAEAVGRLDLADSGNSERLLDFVESIPERGAKAKTKGAVEGVKDALGLGSDDQGDGKRAARNQRRSRS
jgi:gas vesicle structural protein